MNEKDKELFKECLRYCNYYLDVKIHLKTQDISILIESNGAHTGGLTVGQV